MPTERGNEEGTPAEKGKKLGMPVPAFQNYFPYVLCL